MFTFLGGQFPVQFADRFIDASRFAALGEESGSLLLEADGEAKQVGGVIRPTFKAAQGGCQIDLELPWIVRDCDMITPLKGRHMLLFHGLHLGEQGLQLRVVGFFRGPAIEQQAA